MNYNVKTLTINSCNGCDLDISRKNIVNGHGNKSVGGIMFIGEAPGYYEDKLGVPFVGHSGKLLNTFLNAIGLDRNDIYTTNILKCRPPGNRNPYTSEIKACKPYLNIELLVLKPKIIVLLGSIAFASYFNTKAKARDYRHRVLIQGKTIVYHTYHPSYILRNIGNNHLVNRYWKDFVMINRLYRLLINPNLIIKL